MKRIGFLFAASLLTFCIGVGTAAACLQLSRLYTLLTGPSSGTSEKLQPATPSAKVVIKFQRFVWSEYVKYAEFRVINGSSEPLYYSGYGKDYHCSYKVKRKDNTRQLSPCWCGRGLKEQELLPGEAATYQVSLGHTGYNAFVISETGNLEVGFDFKVGRARRPQTVWSNEIIIPEEWELTSK